MKTIDNIKRLLESIEDKKQVKEDECPFEKIAKKYSDLPEDKVKAIIEEVKAVMTEKSESDVDTKDAPEVKDAGKTDSLKAMNELCGSESDEETEDEIEDEVITENEETEDEIKDEVITENEEKEDEIEDEVITENEETEDEIEEQVVTEDEDVDDDLVISEDEDEEIDDDLVISEDEDEEVDDDDLLAETADELDSVASDEEFEEDYLDECGDADTKEAMHEANTAAKAAIANEFDGKGTFSSDIDVLTDYLKDY